MVRQQLSVKGTNSSYKLTVPQHKGELVAVLTALKILNIVSDSAYVVYTVKNIQAVSLSHNSNPSLQLLFNQLQLVVRNRQHPHFITYSRSYPFMGPLTRSKSAQVTEATHFYSLTCEYWWSLGSLSYYL